MYAVVTHMFRISIARLYDNKKEKKKRKHELNESNFTTFCGKFLLPHFNLK